jgi:hypothetical protein
VALFLFERLSRENFLFTKLDIAWRLSRRYFRWDGPYLLLEIRLCIMCRPYSVDIRSFQINGFGACYGASNILLSIVLS